MAAYALCMTSPAPREDAPWVTPRPLALRRSELLLDLAMGEMSMRELCLKYGRTPSTITNWRKHHAKEIEKARENYNDLLAVIPLAQKAARVAELQDLYFEIRGEMEDKKGRPGKLGDDKFSELANQARGCLHDIMVETGQQPPRQTATSNTVTTHIVVGVDFDDWDNPKRKVAVEQTVVEGEVLELEGGDGQDESTA